MNNSKCIITSNGNYCWKWVNEAGLEMSVSMEVVSYLNKPANEVDMRFELAFFRGERMVKTEFTPDGETNISIEDIGVIVDQLMRGQIALTDID